MNLFLFVALGKFINVKDVDEKEAILKSLKDIAVNTKEQCIAVLNSFVMNTRILSFLPEDDKNDMNIEVANEILNLLIKVGENLFDKYDKEGSSQFQSKLKKNVIASILFFFY
jgi:hypothetical protein